MASFKDYIVNYELNVRPVGIESAFSAVKQFSEQVAAPIESVSKAVKGISGAIKSLKETTGSDKKFIFEARTNAQGFQAQLDALVKMAAEKGREASRAFQAGMSLTGAGGKAGAAGVISQGEKKSLEDLIRKRAELQKQLENKYYKDVTNRKTGKVTQQEKAPSKTKAPQAYAEYKALKDEMFAVNRTIEQLEKMKAQTGRKLAALKTSAAPKATVTPVASTSGFDQKWIAKQLKGGSKTVTLTIKAVDQTAKTLNAISARLKKVGAMGEVGIPVVAVANPNTFASLNAVWEQMQAKVKSLVIPVTVASNITNGRAVRGTVEGLGRIAGSVPLQMTAKKTTNLDTKLVSTGQAAFNMNQHLQRMQQLANSRPVKLDTALVPTGQAAFQLNMHLQKLQQLANSRPIKLTTVLTPSATGISGSNAVVSAANTGTSTVPATGTKKDSWDKRAKSLGVEMKKTQKEAIARQKAREDYARQVAAERQAYPNMYAKLLDERDAEQARQQKALFAEQKKRAEQLQKQRAAAERTRASIEALREKEAIKTAAIAERERIKNEMRASQPSRTVTAMYGGGTANTGTPRSAWAQRKASMNGFAYQLMGNTSLGARTPVFLDMMKGMGMMTGVGAAMSTLTNAFTNASEYQNTMVTARAILEANYQGGNFAGDFKNMERIVRDVAKKTKFTAPQAADAARFMAMAGLNIPMINSSIRPIADVAVIGDNDLGEVADKITNIQTAFGIKPNKMRALADALTKTFTSSNTDMMMLAESMEYAAPMAHLAGAQVEDALAMIGIMGNAGIQGSMAGTTLRMMYQNIINPNKKQQGMWKSLGINLRDENGNPRQLMDILGDLRQKVRISREDKDEEGNFKDEGTPIAEAVSKLFRVTASAGAGTLLENLDKVIALAEANRNAAGLSQRISEVKQNDVKGMWAKMTSAFTDAVVTEFEGQNNPIKGYIENLTKYFNSSDFKEMLHDIFDLVTSMMDVLGTFAKIWKGIYDIFGPIIKYTLMAQFFLTQIGYMLAPLRSVWLTLSKGYGAATGLAGIGGAVGGANIAGATMASGTAGAALAGRGSIMSFGHERPNYNTGRINAMRKTASQIDDKLINNKKYLAAMVAANAATSPAIQRNIEKKQMQWFAASQYAGSGPGSKTLARMDGRPGRWNLAYTNPQAASELPNRFKIMAAREREIAALQNQLATRQLNIGITEAAVLAGTRNSVAAHRMLNRKIATVRHASRTVSSEVLNRAVQRGVITRWKANKMAASSGFRSAATWGVTGFSMASMMGGLTKIIGALGKALGFLMNPLTIVGGGLIAAGIAIWNTQKRIAALNNDLQNESKAYGDKMREMVKSYEQSNGLQSIFSGIKAVTIDSAIVNINKDATPTVISGDEATKKFYETVSGSYKMANGKAYLPEHINDETLESWYNDFIKPQAKYNPALPQSFEEFKSQSTIHGYGSDSRRNAVAALNSVIGYHSGKGYAAGTQVVEEIKSMYGELLNMTPENRRALTPEYLQRINELREKLLPSNHPFAADITAENLPTMMKTESARTKAYYTTATNVVEEFLNNSNLIGAIHAFEQLQDNLPNLLKSSNYDQIKDYVLNIAKAMPIDAINASGETSQFYMPFGKNGKLDYGGFAEILKENNVFVPNVRNAAFEYMTGIFEQMSENVPGMSELFTSINFGKEDFVRRYMEYNSAFGNGGIQSFLNGMFPNQAPYAPSNYVEKRQEKPLFIKVDNLVNLSGMQVKSGMQEDELIDLITTKVSDTMQEVISPRRWF